jgi:hypothetical protein
MLHLSRGRRVPVHIARSYTQSMSTGKVAEVELYGTDEITTSADGIGDNNLDNLRACSWKR